MKKGLTEHAQLYDLVFSGIYMPATTRVEQKDNQYGRYIPYSVKDLQRGGLVSVEPLTTQPTTQSLVRLVVPLVYLQVYESGAYEFRHLFNLSTQSYSHMDRPLFETMMLRLPAWNLRAGVALNCKMHTLRDVFGSVRDTSGLSLLDNMRVRMTKVRCIFIFLAFRSLVWQVSFHLVVVCECARTASRPAG